MMKSNPDRDFLKKLTVLYVEDERETAEQFSRFLDRHVARLIPAANGEEGLQAFAANRPDIIITDIRMPIMDGITMIGEIRALDPSVPIVVMTAFGQAEYLLPCINLGVDKYVVKPLTGPSTLQALSECAHRLRVEAELVEALAEAHQREQQLSEKKQKLELLIAGAQLCAWSWQLETGYMEINDHCFLVLGYQPGELPSLQYIETWWDLAHPDDLPSVQAALDAHLVGETPFFDCQYRLRHKEGHWIWIHETAQVLQRDAAGSPLRVFGAFTEISGHKQAEVELARARREADTIIQQFLDSLIAVDTDLRLTRVNQATCSLLGYRQEDLLGQPVFVLFQEPEAKVRETFSLFQTEGDNERRNVELRYRAKDGASLPMSFNLSLLRNEEDGQPLGVVAGAKDISRLCFALEEVSRQNAYIEKLFEILPVGLVAVWPSHEIATTNPAFQEILNQWSARLQVSQKECSQLLIQSALAEWTSNRQCFMVRIEEQGQIGFFRIACARITGSDANGFFLTFVDVTEEKLAEEQRLLLSKAVEQGKDGVVITDTSYRIRYVNPAVLAASGYEAEEYLGKTPWDLREDLVEPASMNEIRQVLDRGETWSGTLEMWKKDGSIAEEEITTSAMRNEQGEISHFVTVKRDVTELRRLQQQLALAQKLESIGQLAAGVAHEINTPMQYIQNNLAFFEQSFADIERLLKEITKSADNTPSAKLTTLMQEVNLDFLLTEIPESLQEVKEGIRRVVRIISALREFSHPGDSVRVNIDINHALENAIIVSRNEWKYVAVLDTEFAEDLPLVFCYPDQLNQMFLNLLINAAHAIGTAREAEPERPGRILVSTRREADWVAVRIGDNGCGIPKKIRHRIFDPFFTTKEVGKGTGQGLAIAHSIVGNHNGLIDCTSIPGQGTEFTILLPLGPQTGTDEDGQGHPTRTQPVPGRTTPATSAGRQDTLPLAANRRS